MSDEDHPNLVVCSNEEIEELRSGTFYKVIEDPDDSRFVQVVFRRPRASTDLNLPVEHGGADVALGQFIAAAMVFAKGFGFGKLVQRGDRTTMFIDFTSVLEQAGEIEDTTH
jgi:hypothetical protein